MKNFIRRNAKWFGPIGVLALLGGFALAQSGLKQGAYFAIGTQNHLVKFVGYKSGLPIFGQSSVVDGGTGTSFAVLKANVTTTAATSDAFTVTGATSTSKCAIGANNASAATNIATTYQSAAGANSVTITHTATASMIYTLLCTAS